MTSRVPMTAGWIAIISATIFVSSPGSVAQGAITCNDQVRWSVPIVADRLERAMELCRSNPTSVPDMFQPLLLARFLAVAECGAEARRDGYRTANSLEHVIENCVADRLEWPQTSGSGEK